MQFTDAEYKNIWREKVEKEKLISRTLVSLTGHIEELANKQMLLWA